MLVGVIQSSVARPRMETVKAKIRTLKRSRITATTSPDSPPIFPKQVRDRMTTTQNQIQVVETNQDNYMLNNIFPMSWTKIGKRFGRTLKIFLTLYTLVVLAWLFEIKMNCRTSYYEKSHYISYFSGEPQLISHEIPPPQVFNHVPGMACLPDWQSELIISVLETLDGTLSFYVIPILEFLGLISKSEV